MGPSLSSLQEYQFQRELGLLPLRVARDLLHGLGHPPGANGGSRQEAGWSARWQGGRQVHVLDFGGVEKALEAPSSSLLCLTPCFPECARSLLLEAKKFWASLVLGLGALEGTKRPVSFCLLPLSSLTSALVPDCAPSSLSYFPGCSAPGSKHTPVTASSAPPRPVQPSGLAHTSHRMSQGAAPHSAVIPGPNPTAGVSIPIPILHVP